MERIYCISGLGADHTVFKRLSIDHYELVPVPWVPFERSDTVSSYATKLAKQINDANPIILGLSFGGMLATEIAKQQKTQKIIIVSSAKRPAELAMPGGGILKWIIRSQIVPAAFLTIPNLVVLNYFGATTAEEKHMVSNVMRNADGHFMKWALTAMLQWRDSVCPANVTHIHGTADKVIPAANVHPDYWINGGTHIMIYNRAAEVSKIISECLSG